MSSRHSTAFAHSSTLSGVSSPSKYRRNTSTAAPASKQTSSTLQSHPSTESEDGIGAIGCSKATSRRGVSALRAPRLDRTSAPSSPRSLLQNDRDLRFRRGFVGRRRSGLNPRHADYDFQGLRDIRAFSVALDSGKVQKRRAITRVCYPRCYPLALAARLVGNTVGNTSSTASRDTLAAWRRASHRSSELPFMSWSKPARLASRSTWRCGATAATMERPG